MAATRRRFWILGLVGVALVGLTAAAVNWRSLTRNATEAWEAQSEKTAISLFRMGEVMSIQARLRERFGSKPDVQYDDVGGIRVLSISFDRAPEGEGRIRQRRPESSPWPQSRRPQKPIRSTK